MTDYKSKPRRMDRREVRTNSQGRLVCVPVTARDVCSRTLVADHPKNRGTEKTGGLVCTPDN